MRMRICLPAFAVLVAAGAAAQDWPQWRGPARDGAAVGFEAPATWPETLTRAWRVDVGTGYATPILVDGNLWLFARWGEEEVLYSIDPESGEVRWRSGYAAPFEMISATQRHGPGPKSTPAYADGRLFVHGMTGSVTAFDAASGEQLWHVPGSPVIPLYHTSASPLVHEGLVIVHVGGHDDGALTAFDAETGDVRWSWDGDGPAYGSAMLFEFDGVEQVVTFSQEHFVGVSFADGSLLWSRPFTTASTTTSQTPVLYGDLVIQNGRGNGVTAFRVGRGENGWTTDDVWSTNEYSLHMANPVVRDGVMFGLSHRNRGQYFALDLESGESLWESSPRQAENAALVRAGNVVISLEDDAELVVFEAGRAGLEEIRRYEVADSETWAQPTVAGNRIYVKDVSRLYRWDLR
ncbi:MAG: PQQ-binding-like beta-propeller repeat protein [Acidobacteria bacterium]|nr:PQQ-binding-like beta-propeller repeat protein [Acidobacteriota bacterium]